MDPLFVQGTLCERVVDADNGHEFFVCVGDVEHDDYACRCVATQWSDGWMRLFLATANLATTRLRVCLAA